MNSFPTEEQLDELQLITYSLLPDETLTFLGDDDDLWTRLMVNDADSSGFLRHAISPARLEVKVRSARVFFVIELPLAYAGNLLETPMTYAVRGDQITRVEQDRWLRFIEEKLKEIADTESVHRLFIFLPPSASLSISGFAKVGYPGVIYAEGQKEQVEEFVGNVKAMQWLALRVRFVEALAEHEMPCERRWIEFQKVGEVVEEMRRLGREQLVLEMGIGSAGSK